MCEEVKTVTKTERGKAGFGSTGTKDPLKSTNTEEKDTPHKDTKTKNNKQDEELEQRVLQILKDTPFAGLKKKPERIIIEICCGKDSLISSGKSFASKGCLCIRITEEDDFNSQQGIQKIMDIIEHFKDLPILAWVTCPCTGGSAYNIHTNWYSGSDATRLNIAGHWQLFRRFWTNYVDKVVPLFPKNRFRVRQGIELPDTCEYWRWKNGGKRLDDTPHFQQWSSYNSTILFQSFVRDALLV